jgi:hypothetical protein
VPVIGTCIISIMALHRAYQHRADPEGLMEAVRKSA